MGPSLIHTEVFNMEEGGETIQRAEKTTRGFTALLTLPSGCSNGETNRRRFFAQTAVEVSHSR